MGRTWIVNSRGIARKVKSASPSTAFQIKDCGANRECPNCHYRIDNSDVSNEWPGLPAGVKFDPSDLELLEHLAAKCGVGNSKPHMFIDEFIPTLNMDQGICYEHPENLPALTPHEHRFWVDKKTGPSESTVIKSLYVLVSGARKDGIGVHFFHRTMNAYASGNRKRRKILSQHGVTAEHVRWHKTGKTKPVIENGVVKGWKKIMVLYRSTKKGLKPDKSNWVMHQYHLGTEDDEKEGEYVVSKISYQQSKETDKNDNCAVIEESDAATLRTGPRTPKTVAPEPPRKGKSVLCDDIAEDYMPWLSAQEAQFTSKASDDPLAIQLEDTEYPAWFAGESQAVDNVDPNGLDDSLLCNEILDSYAPFSDLAPNDISCSSLARNTTGDNNGCGISDLENLELDTPPDFDLADLQFASQDSVFGWLDRL